jgi:poly-gamma-glutamate synthesis protein (capsule biosynthesis protein)
VPGRPARHAACVALAAGLLAATPAAHGAQRGSGEPVRFTVAATGDVLTQPGVLLAAHAPGSTSGFDFRPLLRRLEPRIAAADLALCHQELVIGPGRVQPYPRFLAPPALATATGNLGWDACSVASNHSVDHGREGIATTLAALDAAGVAHTGVYLDEAASRRTLILPVAGVRVALLSYTENTNGLPLPDPFSVNLIDGPAIVADARRARRQGADAVIVNLHDVGDFEGPVPEYQRPLIDRLTTNRAISAIVGQGPHIVRPIRFVNGKPVVFSEGDLLSAHESRRPSGLIAELQFIATRRGVSVESVRYLPLHVRERDNAAVIVGRALDRGQANPADLRAAYRRVVAGAGRSSRVRPVPRRLVRD